MAMKKMLYIFSCCALLVLPCFSLGVHGYKIGRHDKYAYGEVPTLERLKNKCPGMITHRNETSSEKPLGCFCGGREEHLPVNTVCYVGVENWQEWEQGKYGSNEYLCPIGKCDGLGKCQSVREYEKCDKKIRKPK
ncbi:uncharacterized protein LOC144118991 isoform X2 [Amblyomma americanum]